MYENLHRESVDLALLYRDLGFTQEETIKHVLMTSLLPELFPNTKLLTEKFHDEETLNTVYGICMQIIQNSENMNEVSISALIKTLLQILEPENK
jgi:hypothetical protein